MRGSEFLQRKTDHFRPISPVANSCFDGLSWKPNAAGPELGEGYATARVHHAARWGSHILAAGGAGAAGDAGDRSARRPERSRMEAAVGDVPEIVARPRLRRWT